MISRWAWPAVAAFMLALLLSFCRDPAMLADTDTQAAIRAIREQNNPWHWFGADWPLGNHFYRPISTLFFEFDVRVWGDQAGGWGMTNALLCAACVGLTAWLVQELTQRPDWAASAAGVFAFWIGFGDRIVPFWLVLAVAAGAALWDRTFDARRIIVSLLMLIALHHEVVAAESLRYRMMDWIPGRTASVMTVFALFAMASLARGIRLESRAWHGMALVGLTLALGSYEQAIMVPAALAGVAIFFRLRHPDLRQGWVWHGAFWAVLAGYFILKQQILPTTESAYQAQQMRSSGFSWVAISSYAFPAWPDVMQVVTLTSTGWAAVFVSALYGSLAQILANLTAYARATVASQRWEAVGGWLWSLVVFLPMAWVKNFEHYHFFPLALRSLLIVALAATWWQMAFPRQSERI